jgi:hypothetical protein
MEEDEYPKDEVDFNYSENPGAFAREVGLSTDLHLKNVSLLCKHISRLEKRWPLVRVG